MSTGNALIGQSGGPTCVINQSLVGVVEGCIGSGRVGRVLGAEHGFRGLLERRVIDLSRESRETLEAVACTPGAALGSVRLRPARDQCEAALEVLRALDVRWFFYIGGNDTAETAKILGEVSEEQGYELSVVHVPKTIDNDVCETDHCPGYGSAARFVATAALGDDLDNRSLGGVKIDVVMGRHAGWLTAATRAARRQRGDGPHLIYVPEQSFDLERFLAEVEEAYAEHGRCLVCVSEGICDGEGRLIQVTGERDDHGNAQLSGTGFLGDWLAGKVRDGLGIRRVRADTFGYLQRNFAGCVSPVDASEAREVGRHAARYALEDGLHLGSVVLRRDPDAREYRIEYDTARLEDVAAKTRVLDARFIEGTAGIAEEFLEYVLPLMGELPRTGRLASVPA